MSLIWLNCRCRKFSTLFFILEISFIFAFYFFASEASFYIYTLLKIPRFLRNSLNVLASFLDSIRDFKFKSLNLGWPKAGPVYKIPSITNSGGIFSNSWWGMPCDYLNSDPRPYFRPRWKGESLWDSYVNRMNALNYWLSNPAGIPGNSCWWCVVRPIVALIPIRQKLGGTTTMSTFWGFLHFLLKLKPFYEFFPSSRWLQNS